MLDMANASNFKTNRFLKRLLVIVFLTFIILYGLLATAKSDMGDSKSQSILDFNDTLNNTSNLKFDPQWDDFAIALKTGSDVALQRVPIQLLTFLSDVKNKIIIGDRPNVTVGEYEMIDVYTNLYNDSKPSLKKSKNF
jgi:hypothetical protein